MRIACLILLIGLTLTSSFSQTNISKNWSETVHFDFSDWNSLSHPNTVNLIDSFEYHEFHNGILDSTSFSRFYYDSLNRIIRCDLKYGAVSWGYKEHRSIEIYYNPGNQPDSIVEYFTDSLGNRAANWNKTLFYGSIYKPDSVIYLFGTMSTAWIPIVKHVPFYSNQLDSIYFIYYNSSDTGYVNRFQYNQLGKLEGYILNQNPFKANPRWWGIRNFYNATGSRYDSTGWGTFDSLGNYTVETSFKITYDQNNNPITVEGNSFSNLFKNELTYRTDLLKINTGPNWVLNSFSSYPIWLVGYNLRFHPWLLNLAAPYGNEFGLNPIDVDSGFYELNGNWIFGSVSNYYYSQRQAVAIENESIDSGLKVYPNPARDQLTFEFDVSFSDEVRIEFFDLRGIKVNEINVSPGESKQGMDISEFSPGIYFYKINANSNSNRGKLIIE